MEKELLEILEGKTSNVSAINWLRSEYFPEVVKRINQPSSRKRLGLYRGERIPENERNLTDTRNRVSLILEYEIARVSNEIFIELGITDYFWTYVVANRFPDLEVRKRDGNRVLRVEIKSLQSIAEEKSANFDTLVKDINPKTDYVFVLLWEWDYTSNTEFSWDRAPTVQSQYLFNAYSLAQFRDCYWLNKPPTTLGSGFQGFDLKYAVNCSQGIYSEEEGNYGKLTRIWQEGFSFAPRVTQINQDTEKEYLNFKKEIVEFGFINLSEQLLPKLSDLSELEQLLHNGEVVGMKSGNYAFLNKSAITEKDAITICNAEQIEFFFLLNDKYRTTGFHLKNNVASKIVDSAKPKSLVNLKANLASS